MLSSRWASALVNDCPGFFGGERSATSSARFRVQLSQEFRKKFRNGSRRSICDGGLEPHIPSQCNARLVVKPPRKDERGNPVPPTEPELDRIRRCPVKLKQCRQRLSDVSWWMRMLCQRIAMRSNREDNAKGRFFEERFRAIRLIDEASVLACSAYVDLNPIRAAICQTIETSEHTSVKCRLDALRQRNSDERQSSSAESTLADQQTDAANPPAVIPLRARGDAFLSPLATDELRSHKTGCRFCVHRRVRVVIPSSD